MNKSLKSGGVRYLTVSQDKKMAAKGQDLKRFCKCRGMQKETTIKKLWRQALTDRIFSAVSRPCNWCWWPSANQIVVQTKNPIWFYLQTGETGSFHLSLMVLLRKKKRDSDVAEEQKSHCSHQRPHASEQVPAQIGHTANPRNTKRTMKCNPVNFLVNICLIGLMVCMMYDCVFFLICLRKSGFQGSRRCGSWLDGDVILVEGQFFCFSSSEERGTVVLKRLEHHLPLFSF